MVREGLFTRAAHVGTALLERLKALSARHALIGEIRGTGLLIGLELVADRATRRPFAKALDVTRRVVGALRDRGILVAAGVPQSNAGRDGDHIQISPPFTISEGEIDELVAGLDDALHAVAADLP